MNDLDPNETVGGALLVGYSLVVVVLYRSPATALEAATATPQSILYFVVLPVLGLIAGAYASLDGPYSSGPSFVLGTYLGLVGLALTVGSLLSPRPIGLTTAAGVVVLSLSVVTLVSSVRRVVASVRVDPPDPVSD